MKNSVLFTHAVIHTGVTENDTRCAMLVAEGRISRLFTEEREISVYLKEAGLSPFLPRVDLGGQHVYPCLIDGHQHVMMTIGSMALGFSLCEITAEGVKPDTLAGVEQRLREAASKLPKKGLLYCRNYVASAVDAGRLPTRHELDDWAGGRPVVVYNIDGHSTSLSTAMMEKLGLDPAGHDGILSGEENEKNQGRILACATGSLTPALIAGGAAAWQNRCAACGIGVVGALEGNGHHEKDPGTPLLALLARHMDVGVRLYLQYTDPERVKPYRKHLRRLRVGGCGDWEMDGSVGSRSAAFTLPYPDTGEPAPCYYSQAEADELVGTWDDLGYQMAGHAIGDAAVDRLLTAYEKTSSGRMHRIEHGEFMGEEGFEKLVEMQRAWDHGREKGRCGEAEEACCEGVDAGRISVGGEKGCCEDAEEACCEGVDVGRIPVGGDASGRISVGSDVAVSNSGHQFAVIMQPGYAWIDKRYLHSYERNLPPEALPMLRLKSLYDAGICLCASSDSPVQDMDPWLQMQGMVSFYRPEESLSVYEAFRCYTSNAARAIEEEDERGTLEEGKAADFFTASEDLFSLSPERVADFRPTGTWYGGVKYREKTGSVAELARMLLGKSRKI